MREAPLLKPRARSEGMATRRGVKQAATTPPDRHALGMGVLKAPLLARLAVWTLVNDALMEGARGADCIAGRPTRAGVWMVRSAEPAS